MKLPKISIVTPSFNQSDYIEATLCSVLNQEYSGLEYIVIDGGSTDGSVEIIEKYRDKLKECISEPDDGQYDAINKGFSMSSGEIMAWLNSDDIYLPGTLNIVAEVFAEYPKIEWLSTVCPALVDVRGRLVKSWSHDGFNKVAFRRGCNVVDRKWKGKEWIMQESTFWRRSLWEKSGAGLDLDVKVAGDFELWARFYKYADLYGIQAPLAAFRLHSGQKTDVIMTDYIREAGEVLLKDGGRPYTRFERFLRERLLPKVPGRILRSLTCMSPYASQIVAYDGGQERWTLGVRHFW